MTGIANKHEWLQFLRKQARAGGDKMPARAFSLLLQLDTALRNDAPAWKVSALTWEYGLACFNKKEVFSQFRSAHMQDDREKEIRERREWLAAAAFRRGFEAPLSTNQSSELWSLYRVHFYDLKKTPEPRRDTFYRDLDALGLRRQSR